VCVETTDYAQRTFGNAKSISSDQYFADESKRAHSEENKQRIGQFSGATSISSAEYFNREEENNMSVEDIALSLAQTDLSQFGSAVAEGAGKVCVLLSNSAWLMHFDC
jgi:ADP-ribosylation factor GTPase-activating protein 2/3